MTASASQWFWNFIVSRFTPNMVLKLDKGGIVSLQLVHLLLVAPLLAHPLALHSYLCQR